MNDVYYNLRWEFKEYKLLKQGDRPRAQLIEEFSRDENSVLFWTIISLVLIFQVTH